MPARKTSVYMYSGEWGPGTALMPVPSNEIQEYLDAGFKVELPEQKQERIRLRDERIAAEKERTAQLRDTSFLEGAQASLEGLARGATATLSDPVLQALGQTKGEQELRQQKYPFASGASEVAGALVAPFGAAKYIGKVPQLARFAKGARLGIEGRAFFPTLAKAGMKGAAVGTGTGAARGSAEVLSRELQGEDVTGKEALAHIAGSAGTGSAFAGLAGMGAAIKGALAARRAGELGKAVQRAKVEAVPTKELQKALKTQPTIRPTERPGEYSMVFETEAEKYREMLKYGKQRLAEVAKSLPERRRIKFYNTELRNLEKDLQKQFPHLFEMKHTSGVSGKVAETVGMLKGAPVAGRIAKTIAEKISGKTYTVADLQKMKRQAAKIVRQGISLTAPMSAASGAVELLGPRLSSLPEEDVQNIVDYTKSVREQARAKLGLRPGEEEDEKDARDINKIMRELMQSNLQQLED